MMKFCKTMKTVFGLLTVVVTTCSLVFGNEIHEACRPVIDIAEKHMKSMQDISNERCPPTEILPLCNENFVNVVTCIVYECKSFRFGHIREKARECFDKIDEEPKKRIKECLNPSSYRDMKNQIFGMQKEMQQIDDEDMKKCSDAVKRASENCKEEAAKIAEKIYNHIVDVCLPELKGLFQELLNLQEKCWS